MIVNMEICAPFDWDIPELRSERYEGVKITCEYDYKKRMWTATSTALPDMRLEAASMDLLKGRIKSYLNSMVKVQNRIAYMYGDSICNAEAERLECLAEECAALAEASMRLARVLRNPRTPHVNEMQARERFEERKKKVKRSIPALDNSGMRGGASGKVSAGIFGTEP